MFLKSLLKPGQAKQAASLLYAATVTAARRPDIYAELGVADTPDGRFELYTLYMCLVLARLRGRARKPRRSHRPISTHISAASITGSENLPSAIFRSARPCARSARRSTAAAGRSTPPSPRCRTAGHWRRYWAALCSGGSNAADPAPLAGRILADRDALASIGAERLLAGELPWRAEA